MNIRVHVPYVISEGSTLVFIKHIKSQRTLAKKILVILFYPPCFINSVDTKLSDLTKVTT